MRIADRFAGNSAQAEALVGVERAGLQPAVVEGQRFCLGMFQIEFAVVRLFEGFGDDVLHSTFVTIEKLEKIVVHGVRLSAK